MNGWSLLADLVVAIHLAWVLFVVVGQLGILVGWGLRWRWVRDARFRIPHAICMGIVFVEALFGWTCPLTTFERFLREKGGGGTGEEASFVGRLLRGILFYDVPQEDLNVWYLVFGGGVFLSLVAVPIRHPDQLRN